MLLSALDRATASRFAGMVLSHLHREYPNKLDHVLGGDECLRPPRELHPAFFGCFDWHSAVHGHWLLVRLLDLHPDLPEADAIRGALSAGLSPGNIRAEAAYLARPGSGSFERPYGWAWLLKLAEALHRSSVGGADSWSRAMEPLTDAFVGRYLGYLPKLDYPVRSGVHSNTAFGLAFAHDYARTVGHDALRGLVETTAHRLFGRDVDYPAHLEPSGSDFFSPALQEADLMRRVLPPQEFRRWLRDFLPGAAQGRPKALFQPARVSDRSDGHIVHLDGLNLSRAWCARSLAGALPGDDPLAAALRGAAEAHLAASLPHVCSGNYEGEHWLATFAVLALEGA